MTHLEPTEAAAIALIRRAPQGPILMLNLLRFREVADYSTSVDLAPASPIPGAEAYERYIRHARPHLEASGGAILFDGAGAGWFIGPPGERWDRALLIRQASLAAFLAFARNEAYLGGIGHRTAALEDARLLPLVPTDQPNFTKNLA